LEKDFNNIKGILFDVDGTLYYQIPLRIIMASFLILSNLQNPKELLRKIRVVSIYRKSQEALRKMKEPQPDLYRSQIKLTALKTGEPISYIESLVKEWFEKRPLPFIRLFRRKKMINIFQLFHQMGLKVGVYSDYPVGDKLKALGISQYVSTVVSGKDSELCGFKPETNGFALAAQRMGLAISEILYIGDRPEVDGAGAVQAGMPVLIINRFLKSKCNYPSVKSFDEIYKFIKLDYQLS